MAEEIIIDEFALINHIATGGSTQVWEVVDRSHGDRHFAMKVMLPEAFADPEQKSVLKHEAKLCQKFEHPNLVKFHKLVMNKKRAYMVMDYFRSPNLKAQLQSDLVSVQARVGRLFEQLCQVLGYLHDQGWVHRDIKPDNVLFNKGSELRLIDFSLTSRAAGAVAKVMGSKGRAIQGTRTYISPEAILKAPPSPLSDIYSLGVTLYEIIAGEPPFRGSSPDELLKKHLSTAATAPSFFNPNITPEMDRLVLKMLAKKPKDRHKNTHELLSEFRNIKPYKEDVSERDRRLKKEQEERYKSTLDKSGRLDSRADHLKQQLIKDNPELAKQFEQPKKAPVAAIKAIPAKPTPAKPAAAVPPAKAPAAPVAAAPPAPMMHPTYGAPPYGYPGYPQHQYPMHGYPPGGGYPQPGYPPGAYAGGYLQPAPGQSAPPPMPYPGQQPLPGYPMHGAPYGAMPYGGPMPHAPGVPQPGRPSMPPAAPGSGAGAPLGSIPAQQQMLQQMWTQGAAVPAPPGAQPPAGQSQPPRPAGAPSPDLPLMDQLPPVK